VRNKLTSTFWGSPLIKVPTMSRSASFISVVYPVGENQRVPFIVTSTKLLQNVELIPSSFPRTGATPSAVYTATVLRRLVCPAYWRSVLRKPGEAEKSVSAVCTLARSTGVATTRSTPTAVPLVPACCPVGRSPP
jgi:hypothetical protein